MNWILRATVLLAASAIVCGCKPKDAETADTAAPAEEAAESAAPDTPSGPKLVEACHLKMTAPDAQGWTTYWDPARRRTEGDNPSGVRSIAWASAQEKELKGSGGSALDITCGNGDSDGARKIAISLNSFDSTEQDVPMAPGTYPIVPKSSNSKVKPGTFIAGFIGYEKSMFQPTTGTLKIDQFDKRRISGSFVIDGHEILMGSRPFHLEGTFDMPCRDGMLQSDCQSNAQVD
jgi:hypothetical protein